MARVERRRSVAAEQRIVLSEVRWFGTVLESGFCTTDMNAQTRLATLKSKGMAV